MLSTLDFAFPLFLAQPEATSSGLIDVLATIVAAVGGMVIGFLAERLRMGGAYRDRDQIVSDAQADAQKMIKQAELDAEKAALARQRELEKETDAEREKLRDKERLIDRKEVTLDDAKENLAKREQMVEANQVKLSEKLKAADVRETELARILKEEQEQLFRISGLDREQATERLLDRLDRDLATETGAKILQYESELIEKQEEMAREIVGMAVQRYAGIHVSETTTTTVDIPSDDVKGRIIGREGRNIRAFEQASGVDVIVDDTPGVVIVSAFDTVRRETARLSLEKLIQDGRIHPARIEEVMKETQSEMEDRIVRYGNEAIQEIHIQRPHKELVKLMGRLHFRRSYSQNVLAHSIEVANLTAMMAEQLGLDGDIARRCGFFHDIGKAADHELEGGHPRIGADLLKRYKEPKEVVHAALGHHDDIRPEFPYTVLVAAADAISAARPGARRESLERYVRRLEELEAVALGFPGVEQVYAVQAGREVRVIVDPKSVDDREAAKMARDIAETIEETMTYPGEVKVTVLREMRATGVAK